MGPSENTAPPVQEEQKVNYALQVLNDNLGFAINALNENEAHLAALPKKIEMIQGAIVQIREAILLIEAQEKENTND